MNPKKGYRIHNQYALHFVTFTVVGWVDIFTRKTCKDIFIESLKYCQEHKGLIVSANCIMPSHVHLAIRADERSGGLSDIIRDLKRHTSKAILKFVLNSRKESRRDWLKVVFQYHAKYNKNNK